MYCFLKSKCYESKNDILHTFIVYKIPAKEHEVVDHWPADEISILKILFWKYLEYVPLILSNYKRLRRLKIVRFTISSFLST